MRHPPAPSHDLARTTLQLLTIGALILSTVWIVRPFLVAATWATTIAIATWPVLRRTEATLGGRRSLAVAAMTVALLLVVLVPVYLGVTAIVDGARRVAEWSSSLDGLAVPGPPAWLAAIPGVGSSLAAQWQQLAAASPDDVAARLAPVARGAAGWLLGQVGNAGLLLLQLLLTVVVVAILYANGESAAEAVQRFARRLAGPRGVEAVRLAGRAVRAVALAVVVTALLQCLASGIGLAVAGVPFASVLIALVFVLTVAQLGPGLVLLPATVWVYEAHGTAWGTGFLVWALFCGTFDNFVRPVLVKRDADLPLLLIFTGVVGGLLAFGVIGLFVGPVVLAVAYTLLVDWVADDDPDERPRDADGATGTPPP